MQKPRNGYHNYLVRGHSLSYTVNVGRRTVPLSFEEVSLSYMKMIEWEKMLIRQGREEEQANTEKERLRAERAEQEIQFLKEQLAAERKKSL